MKIYITLKQHANEYGIYKVSDDLVEKFEQEMKGQVLVKGNSISEVLQTFNEMDKAGIEFNSELIRYRIQEQENLAETASRQQKIKS